MLKHWTFLAFAAIRFVDARLPPDERRRAVLSSAQVDHAHGSSHGAFRARLTRRQLAAVVVGTPRCSCPFVARASIFGQSATKHKHIPCESDCGAQNGVADLHIFARGTFETKNMLHAPPKSI